MIVLGATCLLLSAARSIAEGNQQRTAQLKELWRVGADDSGGGPILGLVSDLSLDQGLNLYVADRQLSQISVFDSNGQSKGSIGREGDGPGEFRMPYRLHVTPSGEVWVLASRLGFVSRFSLTGEYLGDFEVPADSSSVVPAVRDIKGYQSLIVAHGMYRENTQFVVAGERVEDHRLVRMGEDGSIDLTYFTIGFPGDDARPVWSERPQYLAERWDVSSGGKVFVAGSFLDYRIEIYSASGERIEVIERPYDSRKRSRKEKESIYNWATLNPNGNLRGTEYQIEDFDKDIMALYSRPGEKLWVLTSRGLFDRPLGSVGVFDVFGENGEYLYPVELRGDADPQYDRLFFAEDRLYVVKCFKTAVATMVAGGTENEFLDGCLEPMSVVCFEILPEK